MQAQAVQTHPDSDLDATLDGCAHCGSLTSDLEFRAQGDRDPATGYADGEGWFCAGGCARPVAAPAPLVDVDLSEVPF